VQDQLSDILASRATAVMTNVPGPTQPLTVAGSRLRQMLSWVPQSGDIGMGVSILSYAGQVSSRACSASSFCIASAGAQCAASW